MSAKLEQFEQALDRFGADLSYWPDDLRANGQALLSATGDDGDRARAMLEEAQQLNRLLNLYDAPEPSQQLMDAIAQQVRGNRIEQVPSGWRDLLRGTVPGIADLATDGGTGFRPCSWSLCRGLAGRRDKWQRYWRQRCCQRCGDIRRTGARHEFW